MQRILSRIKITNRLYEPPSGEYKYKSESMTRRRPYPFPTDTKIDQILRDQPAYNSTRSLSDTQLHWTISGVKLFNFLWSQVASCSISCGVKLFNAMSLEIVVLFPVVVLAAYVA